MTRLSDANLELIRTRPQKTYLYLSIFQPQIIMKCRLNNSSIAKGARTIAYDGISLGSYLSVEANFLMKVGTTDEGSDLGSIRIRSATSNQFVVSENSNVDWQDDAYLTVYRYIRLDPIYPRIIQNPVNVEDTLWYKDWDISYTNQNSILGTFPCAGNHHALFKGEQAYYSATGTYNSLGDSLSYEWAFEGGTPTGSTSETPGFVTYPTTGHYVTRLMISGSSGSNDVTYRYVSVYDKPGEGSETPIGLWEVSGIHGSRDEGGYQATFKVHTNVPIEENSLVIIFSEDWYGSTKQSLGGNSQNNEKIFFVGYVLEGTIRKNYKTSSVEFTAGSITEVMKESQGFAISVESKLSPSKWYELYDMDCRRAMYHFLKWHTTVLSIADFQFLGDDRKIQFFDTDRTSMYDALDNLMRNSLLGKVVCDRQGKIWAEVDARAYSNPTGSFTSVMDITKRDWMNEPVVDEKFSDKLSYYEAGGVAYSGVHTGTFAAILAAAPGSTPSFRGSVEEPDGLALLGQAQLNQLVGNIFANENSRLPRVSMDMAGNYRNLDIAPQQANRMTILSEDTVAGIPVDGLYVPDSIDWRYDHKNRILLPNIDFENLVSGEPGETVTMAASADEAGFDSGFSVPQIQIPPLPMLTIPPSLAGMTTGSSCCDTFADLIGTVYSIVLTRNSATPPTPNLGEADHFGFEYASNPKMYDPTTGRVLWLNSGTVAYEVEVRATWTQTQSTLSTVEIASLIFFDSFADAEPGATQAHALFHIDIGCPNYNGGGNVDDISSGVGDSGTIIKTLTTTQPHISPNYAFAMVGGNSSSIDFKVVFTNIRISIKGSAA